MSTVAEIVQAVSRLSPAEKAEFLDELRHIDLDDAWDRQMDADAAAGKLDFLVREADEARRRGELRSWPGDAA